jgi:hypothetical protein
VPADEVGRALEVAAVEVQVAAAEGGAGDAEDGVGGLLDFGGWAVFYYDLQIMLLEGKVGVVGHWVECYVVISLEHYGSHLLRETHCGAFIVDVGGFVASDWCVRYV